MKRLVMVAVMLLGSGIAAHAQTSHYTNLLKHARSDDQLNVDASYCDAQLGPVLNGYATPPAYQRCMRSRGWRYDYTVRHQHHGWIDPDTGLRCHGIMGGFGSVCSNF